METGYPKPAKFESIGYTLKHNIRQYAMLVALIVIMLFFQIATDGILLVPMNVTNLILQNSYVDPAIGMTLCILTGGNIDLSVGSVAASSYDRGVQSSTRRWMSPSPFLGLLIGAVRMLARFLIAYVRIPPSLLPWPSFSSGA